MRPLVSRKQFRTLASYLMLAIIVIIAYRLISNLSVIVGAFKWFFGVISPFFFGFLVAYILDIPCSGIQRLIMKSKHEFLCKNKKTISVITVYILAAFIVYLALRIIVPSLYNSITYFASNFSRYYNSAQEFIDYLNNLELVNFDISIDKIMQNVREFSIQQLPSSFNALLNFSNGILNGFLTLISSVYILLEKENFNRYLNRLMKAFMSESVYLTFVKYGSNLNHNLKQYFYTQTIDSCILGVVATIELFLLKSPYALFIGIMLAIVNYIPYFGSIFGTLLTIVIVAFTQNITTAIIAAIVLLITQQIDANIIQPRLMSGSFSLSPLLVIISITIGGALSGILGMILAIPIVAVMKEILEEIIVICEKRKQSEPQTASDKADADVNNADENDADIKDADVKDADAKNADAKNADVKNADVKNAEVKDSECDGSGVDAHTDEKTGSYSSDKDAALSSKKGATHTANTSTSESTHRNRRHVPDNYSKTKKKKTSLF